MDTKTTYPAKHVKMREDKRPGGWREIGVFVDPVLAGAGNILVAVVTHPCTGAKWFVYPAAGAGICGRLTFKTRKDAVRWAFREALNSDAYRLHEAREV